MPLEEENACRSKFVPLAEGKNQDFSRNFFQIDFSQNWRKPEKTPRVHSGKTPRANFFHQKAKIAYQRIKKNLEEAPKA